MEVVQNGSPQCTRKHQTCKLDLLCKECNQKILFHLTNVGMNPTVVGCFSSLVSNFPMIYSFIKVLNT